MARPQKMKEEIITAFPGKLPEMYRCSIILIEPKISNKCFVLEVGKQHEQRRGGILCRTTTSKVRFSTSLFDLFINSFVDQGLNPTPCSYLIKLAGSHVRRVLSSLTLPSIVGFLRVLRLSYCCNTALMMGGPHWTSWENSSADGVTQCK